MRWVIALLSLAAFAAAKQNQPNGGKSRYFSDSQKGQTVVKLIRGLDGAKSKGTPFKWQDEKYYDSKGKDSGIKFYEAWQNGFIDKDSTFTLYHYKNRQDTFKLFQIFYFAKDFDTFIEMANWARYELHPLQFMYSFIAGLMHREDTSNVHLPKLYEVLPHYYLPPEIVQGVKKAASYGTKVRSFEVNSTGHEYSWYKGQVLESFKSSPVWNQYDTRSRLSYFTEDVHLADYMTKSSLAYAPWIYPQKYYNITRKGEHIYRLYKNMLSRYNLERYANDLPPAKPIEFTSYIKVGYNPHLSSLAGRPFAPRPDSMIIRHSNPEGVHRLLVTKRRYDDVSDLLTYINPAKETYEEIEDNHVGLDKLGELVYGSTHPKVRSLYRPYHYHLFYELDQAITATDDPNSEGSVLSNMLTEVRDPLYYRVLATVNEVFKNYFSKLPPYKKDELIFPGVKVLDFKTSPLVTYFEPYSFQINNIIPMDPLPVGYNMSAVKERLNHKYFKFSMMIDNSGDGDLDAAVRLFISPTLDSAGRVLSLQQCLQHATPYYYSHLKLKKGQHEYKGDSNKGFYSSAHSLLDEEKSSSSNDIDPKSERCMFPPHLLLPKGGKPFTLFAVVSPRDGSNSKMNNPCYWDFLQGVSQFPDFPTDKRVSPYHIELMDNMLAVNLTISHIDKYQPY